MARASDTIRFGIIGFRMGWTHASKLLELDDCELVAISEKDEAGRVDTELFGARFYTDYREMLASEKLDAVVIAVPHHLMSQIGCECLEKGLHVLLEKPMAHNLEAADRLLDTAERVNRHVAVGYQWRFHAQTRKVKEMIDRGDLGQISLAHSFWVGYSPADYFKTEWKGQRTTGGGPTFLVGSHVIDTFRYLFGEVQKVNVLFSKTRDHEAEDNGQIQLRFHNGPLVSLTMSTAVIKPPGPVTTYYIMGDKASVSYPPLNMSWYPWYSPHCYYKEREQGIAPKSRMIPVPNLDPYLESLRNFSSAIRGESDLISPGVSARKTLAVLTEIIAHGDASLNSWETYDPNEGTA